jgi:hypothetical protein
MCAECATSGSTSGERLAGSQVTPTASLALVSDDLIDPAELTALHRRWLKDAVQLLHTCQDSVRIAYRTDLIG